MNIIALTQFAFLTLGIVFLTQSLSSISYIKINEYPRREIYPWFDCERIDRERAAILGYFAGWKTDGYV